MASIQDSLTILMKALKLTAKHSKNYYMRDASKVSNKTFAEVDFSLTELANLLLTFIHSWIDSREKGPDAVIESKKLEDRIDIKLTNTGKLDFEQFKRILRRLNRSDDALRGLNRIGFYIAYYRGLCLQKGHSKLIQHVDIFTSGTLKAAIRMVEEDSDRFSKQLDRCNLYYRNVLKSKTFKLAFGSLLISAFAVTLAILNTIWPALQNIIN